MKHIKHTIRSYLVFTPFWYRMILFAILPAVLLGLQVVSAVKTGGTWTLIPLFVPVLVFAEVMMDTWFLGGIQEKGSEKIDYLKTSPRGMGVMGSVLILDQVRRIFFSVLLFGLSQAINLLAGGDTGAEVLKLRTLVLAVLLTYDLSVLGIFVCRFASFLWLNLLCAYIGAIAGVVVFVACMAVPMTVTPLCIALAVIGAGLSVLAVKIPMLKVEGSYYDK